MAPGRRGRRSLSGWPGAGWKVAFAERHLFGGTCVNTGCTPTKAMVASAHAAHLARRARDFGVAAGEVTVDMRAVKARKDAIVMKSRTSVEKWLRGTENCTVFTGQAVFEGPKTVRVGDDVLEAGHIFINVGARPLGSGDAGCRLGAVPYQHKHSRS